MMTGCLSLQAYSQQPRLHAPQQQLPTLEEQGICIGQTFLVAADNGRDLSRRVHVLGFCRSIDLVSEVRCAFNSFSSLRRTLAAAMPVLIVVHGSAAVSDAIALANDVS